VDRRAGHEPDELDAAVEDTGVPFDQLQAEQIALFRDAWAEAGHEREPRVSVSRSIFPLVDDLDRAYFGGERGERGPGRLPRRRRARFGKSYAGEPDELVEELAEDEAVAEADTLLLTVPNQLGVDYNAQFSADEISVEDGSWPRPVTKR
jgi:alkanesulfonate monooxygenase SsuD/methylene tetrahydromethanopterin reductase-like flavin-dependent oxidoreductase (luciferase family)